MSGLSGRTLATATSAINDDDFHGGLFRGTVDLVFAADSSAVCIEEGVSNALPAVRYILIRREVDRFEVVYLLPESNIWTTDGRYEFPYEHPEVVGLSKDTMTFRYPLSRQVRTVNIHSVHTSKTPRTAL